jgi:hypothetical protein
MTTASRPLTLALPKGRLLRPALDLLRRAGLDGVPADESRRLIFSDPAHGLRYLFLKPVDVPTYVEYGAADLKSWGRTSSSAGTRRLQPLDLGAGWWSPSRGPSGSATIRPMVVGRVASSTRTWPGGTSRSEASVEVVCLTAPSSWPPGRPGRADRGPGQSRPRANWSRSLRSCV